MFNVFNLVLVLLVIVAVVEAVDSKTTKKPAKGGGGGKKKGAKGAGKGGSKGGSKGKGGGGGGGGGGKFPEALKYKDPHGIVWPDFCEKIPKPDPGTFDMMTQPFPCYKIGKSHIVEVVRKRDKEESTPMRCVFDFVLMFLNSW